MPDYDGTMSTDEMIRWAHELGESEARLRQMVGLPSSETKEAAVPEPRKAFDDLTTIMAEKQALREMRRREAEQARLREEKRRQARLHSLSCPDCLAPRGMPHSIWCPVVVRSVNEQRMREEARRRAAWEAKKRSWETKRRPLVKASRSVPTAPEVEWE